VATIQSLGIGSGLLTSELLDSILEAERAPVERRLNMDQAMTEAKISAFGEVRSALSSFNSSVQALTRQSSFATNTATSTNDSVLTGSAASNATAGTYAVDVTRLASSQTLASQTYSDVDAVLGTGTLTFRFGETELDVDDSYLGFNVNTDAAGGTVTIDQSNNTLSGIRDAVNAANIGVQASIVDDGTGYRLLFTSKETGVKNSLEVVADGDAGLDALNFNNDDQGMTQTVAAGNAEFSVNGLTITRNSNTVTSVIPGTTLQLTGAGQASITVGQDASELVGKLQTFVESYNGLKTLTDALTAFDPDAGDNGQGSLLTGDSTVRLLANQINRLLRSTVQGLAGEVRALSDVGITTNKDDEFRLQFDAAIFTQRLTDNPRDVRALFAEAGDTSDAQIQYVSASADSRPGTYDVEITRHATTGRYDGLSVPSLGAGDITIDETNDRFVMVVNGKGAEIFLDHGVYSTAQDLAEHLQLQINADSGLRTAGHAVSVSYDTAEQRFAMVSNDYGSGSEVRFTEMEAGVANTLGLLRNGAGPYSGNQLAALATATGDPSENFIDPMVIEHDTSFRLSINGTQSPLITIPGDAGSPATYNTPDDLIAAVQAEIDDALSGTDHVITVSYQFNAEDGFGRLVLSSDQSADTLQVNQVSASAQVNLGLFSGNGAAQYATAGLDVEGRINGVEAQGTGQYLRATTGSTPAQPGFYLNGPHGNLGSGTLDDSFRITVDGVTSANITLGAFSNTDPVVVANALQTAINNDPALLAAGSSVKVEFDTNTGGFGIISNSTGATSSVSITELQGNAGAILGFAIGKGAFGKDGQDAKGDTDPAAGLRLRVTGGPLGDRGTVTYIKGIANDLRSALQGYLDPEGILNNRTSALNRELDNIADKRAAFNERMARSEQRLQASFMTNDLIIQQINSSADFLTSQLQMLEALATPRKNNRSR
jgi:flagellar capping protein FliD